MIDFGSVFQKIGCQQTPMCFKRNWFGEKRRTEAEQTSFSFVACSGVAFYRAPFWTKRK